MTYHLLIVSLLYTALTSAQENQEGQLTPLRFGHYSTFKESYNEGPHYHWLSRSLESLGYRIEVVWLPKERHLKQLNDGLLDGNLSSSQLAVANKHNLISVSEPFVRLCYRGYKWPERTLPESNKWRVGTFYQWKPSIKLARAYWPVNEHYLIQTSAKPIKILRSGRVDVLFMPSIHADFMERTQGIKLVPVTEVIQEVDTYIYMHKRHKDLVVKLAERLRGLRPPSLKVGC